MISFKQLARLLINEDDAEAFLQNAGILKAFQSCPSCGSSHMGRVRRGKYKCYECTSEWNIRKGSYLEGKKIELPDFIGCLKFFADGVDATKCAHELEVSPKLTRRVFAELRKLLIGEIQQVSENATEVTIYIREVDGQVFVDTKPVNENDSAYGRIEAVRTINQERAFMYNLRYKNQTVKSMMRHINRINGLDNFYRYCRERLLSFRGRDLKSLVAVMKELAFRYNHRNEDILDILLTNIIKVNK